MPCSGGAYQRYNLSFCNLQVNAPAVIPSEVVGVVRGSEKPSIFVPANDPSSCQWFYVDVPALACAAGLPENTIYIEDVNENVNPSNPYPIPKDANTLIRSSVMPQDHLNYTFTWYAFASLDTPNFGCTCNPLLKGLVCCYCIHNHSLFIYALMRFIFFMIIPRMEGVHLPIVMFVYHFVDLYIGQQCHYDISLVNWEIIKLI